MIHVIVPSFECPVEIERCLASIEVQEYPRELYNVVVIDDCSGNLHRRICEDRATAQGYTLIRNRNNMRCPYTIKQGIEASGAADDDIIFLVDGDDFLPPWALARLAAFYERYPQLWLTYGNYQPHPHGWPDDGGAVPATEYPTFVRWERDFRTHGTMRFNHPITFRRFLWNELTDEDLQQDDGSWFVDGYDKIITIPMLEMAAPDHYACIEDLLYYYNTENMISESRLIHSARLVEHAKEIFPRPKKPQLVR